MVDIRYPISDIREPIHSGHAVARVDALRRNWWTAPCRRCRGLAAVSRARRAGALVGTRITRQVERAEERRLEGTGARARLVVPGRLGRQRVAHDRSDDGEGDIAAADGVRGRERTDDARRRDLQVPRRRTAQRQEQPRFADADCRRRPRLRPLRRGRDRSGVLDRYDRLENKARLRIAARQRRLAATRRRSPDHQLRRVRSSLRRRARHADGEDEVAPRSARAALAGLFDAAADPCGRARSGGQRRGLWRVRVGAAERPRDLARRVSGRVQQRTAPRLWRRAGVHHDRLQPALAAGGPPRRQRGCDEDTRRLEAVEGRAAHAVTAVRRGCPVSRLRQRHRHLPRRGDRCSPLAEASGQQFLGLAGARRRPPLFSRRGRPHGGGAPGQRRTARRKRAGRRDARVDGCRLSVAVHQVGDASLSPRPSLTPSLGCCGYVEFQLYRVLRMRYITYPTTLVLQAVADGVRYGFDIADHTGLQTGTVYPSLRRLDTLGCVRSNWESEKIARREQRPARRYYEITKAGAVALEAAIKRFENLGRLRPGERHA